MVEFLETLKHQWAQLIGISFLAAAVHMYISKRQFTFFHYLMGVMVALFAAYLAEAGCKAFGMSESSTTAIIAISAYIAPHLFEALLTIGQRFSQEPLKLLSELIKLKRG